MGLLQKAVETYESHLTYAAQNREGMSMMAPIGHIVTRADLEITLDADGNFVDAMAVDKSEPKIIIPVTEGSAGRTSAPCAHPLCEQIGYLIPENQTKFALFVEQLTAWNNSEFKHPKLLPILTYVLGKTILADLERCGLIATGQDGKPDDEKILIRWRILGEEETACWLDKTLFEAFTQYYISKLDGEPVLCMVSGENSITAKQHPKGIIPINGNAKLISANDSSGFTYRGRFSEEWQAVAIGYSASQKAHNALRWLAQEQGTVLDGRTFLCWNPQGRRIMTAMQRMRDRGEPVFRPSDYRDALADALNGRKAELKPTDGVVLAVFDAATTGRLALTYYNELQGDDFLQRLHDWDVSCCWPHWKFGIETPTLRQIVNCAFGTQREEKDSAKLETDERILRQQMQRLVAFRVDKGLIGADIVKALANRASRPLAYDKYVWEDILFTACAVIRKYRMDRFKEEWNMALEPEKKDRSYQFGRLLAILEKVEKDTYSDDDTRQTNAIRVQSVFRQTPLRIANQIEAQLNKAYFPKLKPATERWYRKQIGEIMVTISQFPEEDWNKPLGDSYLMGYYLQRNALYTKKTDNTEEDEEQ